MGRKSNKDKDNDILSRIDKRQNDWFWYYSENNNNYRRLHKFVYLEDFQWRPEEIKEYREDGRPRLTFNMLPRYITNLAAEFAENVPDIEVRSEHFTEVDQDEIDLMTNLLRKISLDSRNDVVYQTAAQCAWTGGYGAFRIIVERERVGSFNMVPRYMAIHDATRCSWDPMARLVDKSDGNFCSIAVPMSKEEFAVKYPGIPVPKTSLQTDNTYFEWITDDQVTVVDYWEKVPFKQSYSLFSDNTIVKTDESAAVLRQKNKAIKLGKEQFPADPTPLVKVVKEEEQDDFKIMFYRVIKDHILEKRQWDGKKLPIIFVGGVVKWVNGKERTYGLVHWMRDAQRAYNYARSEYLYRLKLNRYEKFLVTPDNVKGAVEQWKNVYKAKSALVYHRGPNGEVPIVIPPPQIGNDLQVEMTRSLQDLQSIPGRFDPNLGAAGTESSGVAVSHRQRAGNLNVKEYFDNVTAAVESGARVTLDLIPKLFDTERLVSVQMRDGAQKRVMINQGEDNKISEASFDVRVSAGSSFIIQQSENVQKLIGLVQANPKLADLASDLIVKNLDLQQGPQLVERIQRYSIPQIAAAEGSQDKIVKQQAQQQQQNPQQQMQMQQLQLQMEAAKLALQKSQLENAGLQQKLKLDQSDAQDNIIKAQSSEITAQANMMNAQTNRIEAQQKGVIESSRLQTEQQKAELELQTEIVRLQAELAKEEKPFGSQQNLDGITDDR